MGWFDSEKEERGRASEPERPAPAVPTSKSTPPASSSRGSNGSTLGERVHVNGTIVSEESLRILGKVEGKIQARQELNVAKGADVRAVIQGRRVVLEGSVKGDILASEVVLLGPTASLVGNISTPALHIQEGAFFKGNVEMRAAESTEGQGAAKDQAAAKAQGSSKDRGAKEGSSAKEQGGGKGGPSGSGSGDEDKAEAQKGRPGTVPRDKVAPGESGDSGDEKESTAKSGEARGATAGQRSG